MNVFKYLCHQKPERSFFYKGHQFPVCARCTGAYLGIAIGVLWYLMIAMPYNWNMVYLATLMALPAVIDGGTQYLNFRESNNKLRFVTGLLLGISLIIFFKCLKHRVII